MDNLQKIIDNAHNNNNKISVEKIIKLGLEEEEFDLLMEILKNENIEISMQLVNNDELEEIYNKIDLSDSAKMYLCEMGKYPLLSEKEQIYLYKIYNSGNQTAKQQLINSNLRLVIYVIKRYFYEKITNDNFLDLVQEGNLGLIKAVDKFDISKGYKFSTYAIFWIRQAINKYIIERAAMIRKPAHIVEKINKVLKYQHEYRRTYGEEPTEYKISEELGFKVQEVEKILKVSQEVLSLDHTISTMSEEVLGDFIVDNDSWSDEIIYRIDYNMIKEPIKEMLSERNYQILLYRFGFKTGKTETLDQTGSMFNITRERVRQLEAKSLKELRKKFADKNKKNKNQN